jgi:hypothetical protein
MTDREKELDGGRPIKEATATREGEDGSPARGKREPGPRAQRVGRGPRINSGRGGRRRASRQAGDRLLRLQFAIIIAPGNLRPCRGQNYVRVFGLLLPEGTQMVCIWRKISQQSEGGSGR